MESDAWRVALVEGAAIFSLPKGDVKRRGAKPCQASRARLLALTQINVIAQVRRQNESRIFATTKRRGMARQTTQERAMNDTRRKFTRVAGALGLAAAFGSVPAFASDASEAAQVVQKSQATLHAFEQKKDMSEFRQMLGQAKGVLIFPKILKAGFVLGGSGGTGVLLVRDAQTGAWVGPAFYTMGSASFGLQAGASSAEMVMLVHSQKALESLFTSKLKLGGDASVAVWKSGMGASAALGADFVAFSMVKGAFAGLAVDGSVLDVRQSLNATYYGREVTPADILVKRDVSNPGATSLQHALKAASR
jgi:lipid-binding SYLF domain-containing protein